MISGWPERARYLAKQLGLKGRMPVSGTPELGTLAPSESVCFAYRHRGRVLREVRESSVVLLPCASASVAVARRRITADLLAAGIFEAAVGDAALVMSELLSNAILHARPLPGRGLQVAWIVGAGSVEIAVTDGGGPTRPHAAHPSLSSLGGRGLEIVAYLSDHWGVRADSPGTTVWAVLPAPPARI
jgi:anti-sigma regulatory factor (Ser/Thr protein kinase)